MHSFPGTTEQRYKIYEAGLYSSGFITITYLIQVFSELEFYEEAGICMSVLKDISKKLNYDLPTVYDAEALKFFEETVLELGGKGKTNWEDKIPDLATKIINKIKQLK